MLTGRSSCGNSLAHSCRGRLGCTILAASALLATLYVGAVAQAAERVALVIGISDYQRARRLRNPANDAQQVARRLERFGFDVEAIWHQPVTKAEFDAALARLHVRASDASAAVVYFAGHGIELGGRNYLLPADARLDDERDVRREAVALDELLEGLQSGRKPRVNLVILDACRENPFRSRLVASGRTVSRGLGRPTGNSDGSPIAGAPNADMGGMPASGRKRMTVGGTMIAYATAENTVAADGDAENSPYTAALIEMMDKQPQLEIGLFFRRVRAAVQWATNNDQQPWEYGSLVGEFYLHVPPADNAAPADNSPGNRTQQSASSDGDSGSKPPAMSVMTPPGKKPQPKCILFNGQTFCEP